MVGSEVVDVRVRPVVGDKVVAACGPSRSTVGAEVSTDVPVAVADVGAFLVVGGVTVVAVAGVGVSTACEDMPVVAVADVVVSPVEDASVADVVLCCAWRVGSSFPP